MVALSTGRSFSLAVLPINLFTLLVRKGDIFALVMGKFRTSHVCVGEVARFERGVAQVGVSQAGSDKIYLTENGGTEITSRKVSISEINLLEIIPAKRGQSQVLQVSFTHKGAKETDADLSRS